MRFPNLAWALHNSRIRQYELAGALGVSESWLSRALSGRVLFQQEQRKRIAEICGYGEKWLFEIPVPPEVGEPELVGGTAAV